MSKDSCERCNELAKLLEEAENRIQELIEENKQENSRAEALSRRAEQLELRRIDERRGVVRGRW